MRRIVTILTCVCLVGCLAGCEAVGSLNGAVKKELKIGADLVVSVEVSAVPNAGNDSPDGKVTMTGDVDVD